MAGRWRKQLPPRRSPSTSSVQELPSQARFEGDGLSASAQPSPAARSVIARLGESSKQSSCVMPSASERHSVVEGRPVGVLRAAEARARGCPQRREREPAAGRSSWNRSQFGQGRVDARRRETCPVTRRTSACVLRLQHVASVRSRLLPSARRLTAGGGELSGVLVRQAQAKLTLRADRTIGGCRVVILVGMVREHSDPSLTKLGVTTTLHAARHRWDQSPPLPPSKLRPALAPLVA